MTQLTIPRSKTKAYSRAYDAMRAEKRCPGCQETLPREAFYTCPSQRDGLSGYCKQCSSAKAKSPAVRAQRKERYNRDTSAQVDRTLRYKYGISLDEYNKMVAAREGRCDLCGSQPKKLVVDHDHANGAVRGLLCNPCNVALGMLGDSIDGLRRAIAYLSGVRA